VPGIGGLSCTLSWALFIDQLDMRSVGSGNLEGPASNHAKVGPLQQVRLPKVWPDGVFAPPL